jgi:hypothetical protein
MRRFITHSNQKNKYELGMEQRLKDNPNDYYARRYFDKKRNGDIKIMTGKTKPIDGKAPVLLTHYQALEEPLVDVGKARNEARARLVEIHKKMEKATPNELDELKKDEAAVNEALRKVSSNLYDKFNSALDNLKVAAAKKNRLNLEDEKLRAALTLTKAIGKDMDFETKQEINNSLANNQGNLRAIKNLYKSLGIETQSIEKLMYEPEEFDNWGRAAGENILGGHSVNEISSRIAKFAQLDGVDFPATVDEEGIMLTTRRAAGLPDDPPEE